MFKTYGIFFPLSCSNFLVLKTAWGGTLLWQWAKKSWLSCNKISSDRGLNSEKHPALGYDCSVVWVICRNGDHSDEALWSTGPLYSLLCFPKRHLHASGKMSPLAGTLHLLSLSVLMSSSSSVIQVVKAEPGELVRMAIASPSSRKLSIILGKTLYSVTVEEEPPFLQTSWTSQMVFDLIP